jgi:two-component system nitrate/nitrite response regulator NarL
MTHIAAPVRVMLVDDHPHGLEGMREIVASDPAFTVVGEASSGEEALTLAAAICPDLVLMDINMPGIGGLEATFRLKQLHPSLKIIMVTVSDDITNLFEAIKRGAQGYLLKNIAPSSWLEYLHAVSVDEAPMSKALAFRLLQEFTGMDKPSPSVDQAISSRKPAAGAAKPLPDMTTPLTDREKVVLEHVATGASNREIAGALSLSEHTVKNHLKNILQKLHLANRVQLTIYALQQGIVEK